MREDLTEIVVLLDRSGSMRSIASDMIGGFNKFLEDQKKVPGEAKITLHQFDDCYQTDYQGLPIAEAPDLTPDTFVPRGTTALLDSLALTIEATGQRLAAIDEGQRPGKVMVVVVTDGLENASVKYSRHRSGAKKVLGMVTHQREQYSWDFVYLGANQDAIATSAELGFDANAAMTYAANSVGAKNMWGSTSSMLRSVRTGASKTATYTDEDRKKQEEAA